jgi:polyphosphate glucokinase
MANSQQQFHTLAVDIGGSGIKVMVLDGRGNPLTERDRAETPATPTPEVVLATILSLAEDKSFDRVSAGFPGVVKAGKTLTAANLNPEWIGFDLAAALTECLGKPARVVNDADMQGMGAVSGQGVEMVITLGTGMGSALFIEGRLVPNLELGHHPFQKGETYEQQLGRAALDLAGKKRWNIRLQKAIATIEHLFNYDRLYIGGGNTKKIELTLSANIEIVPNVAGLLGGIALWRD